MSGFPWVGQVRRIVIRSSGIDASAALLEFRHAAGEQSAQLRRRVHRRSSDSLSGALIAVAPGTVSRNWRREAAGDRGGAPYRRPG